MLKRFIRDCVVRDAAVYSPWQVKKSVAERYGLPTEMSDEVKEGILRYRERQLDKRKREREERLGINGGAASEVEAVEEEKPKTKKQKKEEEKRLKEEQMKEEEELKKKKPLKYPAEGESVAFGQTLLSHDLQTFSLSIPRSATRQLVG